MDKKVIEKIIEAGNEAPSGGNSQPWKFIVKENAVEAVVLPEKDHKVMNFKNRGTYVAHGALMENIKIASRHLGYEPKFELFPRKEVSAKITFHSPGTEKKATDLYHAISERHSNRKSYKIDPLSKEQKAYLFQEVSTFPQCELVFVEGSKISQAAENLALDVSLSLQNPVLHELLFHEIIWKEEEQKHRHGLYIKTMEVAPPKAVVFKLLKNWKILQFFTKLKVPQKIYEENTATMSSAGLFGAILVEDSDENFIHAGGLLENIWLRAAKLGLGFHLTTGLLFLWQRAHSGEAAVFSENEREILNKAYQNLKEIFQVKNKIIALTFRIGQADPPSASSYKKPPEIEWR
jgi:nitroreductase